MFSIIGTAVFSFIILLCILLIFGAPLGEFSMGGQFKTLPKKLRFVAFFMLLSQVFAAIILLQAGSFLPLWFSVKTTRIICYMFAGYLAINSVANLFSPSKKEKYVMTPLSILAAVCFFITAIQM